MTALRASKQILAGLAIVSLVAGCHSSSSGDPASLNDFGGSGVVLNSFITGPFVLFQDNSTSRLINRDGGTVQQNGVRNVYSVGAYVDPNDGNRTKLFVNDRGNHRILIFNTVPRDATAQPDVVVGQANFIAGVANAGAGAGGVPSAAGFNDNVHMSVCSNGMMFVSDRLNNRVLVYNSVPTVNGIAADFVIGQPNFSTNTQVDPPTANSLYRPYAAYCMANKLFVVDKDNNRILVFDPIPNSSQPAASYVIGQPDMLTNSSGCAADKLNSPYEILRRDDAFYVVDGNNHRVLKFDGIPATTGAAATAVLGQADLSTSCLRNRTDTDTPSATSFWFPNGLAAKANVLAVSDHSNNRIVFFNLPMTTDQAAFAQIGQPDFTTSTEINPPTASSVAFPKGFIFDHQYLWISDGRNNRVAVIPLPY
jgi:hypothetical protein